MPTLADWKSEANDSIERIRKRDVDVILVDADGKPAIGANLQINQTRKAFPFGSAISARILTNTQWQESFKKHFNWAVFENESKWYSNERTRGQVNYRSADAMLDWCDANGISVRGHCIFWEPSQWQPNWVRSLDGAELKRAVESRIADAVPHFKGRFKQWDVNNEMLHGTFYIDKLGKDIRPWMYKRARELDSSVKLFVNDFNILSVDQNAKQVRTDDYVAQIRDLIAQGAPIDGIGIQGHIWKEDILAHPEVIRQRLDKVAAIGLPIWITEFDVADPDDKVRADKLELVYRTAFSHPAVQGIVMWVYWAGNSWRGEDAALFNRDWTINEEGKRFESLLDEWNTSVQLQTDAQGKCHFRGFHGDYSATIQLPGQSELARQFTAEPGQDLQVVRLSAGR